MEVTAHTGVVCILGHPVRHSRSPAMHNAAFADQGLDLVYVAFDVSEARLPSAVDGLRSLGFVGANVTIPHKEAVVTLLDETDDLAAKIGAVNTIVADQGRLRGYNTDAEGFRRALEEGWGRGPAGARCLVLGAGGAARAIVAALVHAGAAEVVVHNRTSARARRLCSDAADWSSVPVRLIETEELRRAAAEADLIVNATSVGLDGTFKAIALPVDMVRDGHVVMDVVYSGSMTPFLAAAHGRGATVIEGTEMLVQQACLAYELWTGRIAPVQLFRHGASGD